MKKILMLLITLLAMSSVSASSQAVRLGTLHVIVEGLRNQQGQLKVALEKSAEEFDQGPLHESRYRGETAAVKGQQVDIYFRDLPFGTYAIKTFHDADGNGILNTNFMGIPTEDYGFSNNVRGTMGPAKFHDARFEMDAEAKTIRIRVK